MRSPRGGSRWSWCVDSLLIFAAGCALIWPLLTVEYFDKWASIESTFMAQARTLRDHLPHHHWQPLWYCGTRVDYVYPPALHYGTALLSAGLGVSVARAYHIYVGVMYALAFVGIYVMVRQGSQQRWAAWLSSAGAALLSPCFLFFPEYWRDSTWGAPQRLHALHTYGEGPHSSALTLIPFVFAGCIVAFRTGKLRWIVASSVAAALVVANNFYGATALAILFPVFLWTYGIELRSSRVLWAGAAVPLLAYAWNAWWFVPSYVRITLLNLRHVAERGSVGSTMIFLALIAMGAGLSWWVARRPQPLRAWTHFVAAAAGVMSLYVLGRRYLGIQVGGETTRLAPELDLLLILTAVELVRRVATLPSRGLQAAAVVLAVSSFVPAAKYLRNFHGEFTVYPKWRERTEYKVSKWLYQQHPNARVSVAGSHRFWFNVWFDSMQIDGGSLQGMLNQYPAVASWRLLVGDDADLARLWLQALAADIAVVPEGKSQEIFHDVMHPQMYRNNFALMRDDGEGNRFYSVPRRTRGIVRLVDAARLQNLPGIPRESETEPLRAYVQAIEAVPPGGPDTSRIRISRPHPDRVQITADVKPGEMVLWSETFDPNWEARSGGQQLAIRRDKLDFMLIAAPPGFQTIAVEFRTPLEVRVGWAIFALALLAVIAGALSRQRERSRSSG